MLDGVPGPQGKGRFGGKPSSQNMQLHILSCSWRIQTKSLGDLPLRFRHLPNYFGCIVNLVVALLVDGVSAAVEFVVVAALVISVQTADVGARAVSVRRRSMPEAGALLKVVPGVTRLRHVVVAATSRVVATV